MKKENIFYLLFLATILAIRTWVFFFPQRKLIIDGTTIHHFWTGLLLALVAILLSRSCTSCTKLSLILFSVGSGLVADESIYIALGGRTVSEYWAISSVIGAIVMAVVVFLARKKLVAKI
jgi:VanZ family protein